MTQGQGENMKENKTVELTRDQVMESLKNGGGTFVDGKKVDKPNHNVYAVGDGVVATIHLDVLEHTEDVVTTIKRVIAARTDLNKIGIWVDKDQNIVCVDKVTFFLDIDAALDFAKVKGERAIYNLKDDQTIFVEGGK